MIKLENITNLTVTNVGSINSTTLSNVKQNTLDNALTFDYKSPGVSISNTEYVWYELLDKDQVQLAYSDSDLISNISHSIAVGQFPESGKPWTLNAGPHFQRKSVNMIGATSQILEGSYTGSSYQGTHINTAQMNLVTASVAFSVPNNTTLEGNRKAWIIITPVGESFSGGSAHTPEGSDGVFGFLELTAKYHTQGKAQLSLTNVVNGTTYQVGLYLGDTYRLAAYFNTVANS